jgi:hypothetical protein
MPTTISKKAVSARKQPYYPVSDGEPMAETNLHWEATVYCKEALQSHYALRDDVYVASDNFLYFVEGSHARSYRRIAMWCSEWQGDCGIFTRRGKRAGERRTSSSKSPQRRRTRKTPDVNFNSTRTFCASRSIFSSIRLLTTSRRG